MTETVAAPTETAAGGARGLRAAAVPDHLKPGEFNDPLRPAASTAFMACGWGDADQIPAAPPAPPAGAAGRPAGPAARAGCPSRCPRSCRRAGRRAATTTSSTRSGPSSDYVWLTGDQTPGGVLLLDPGSAAGDVLFLLPPSGRDDGEFYSRLDGPASCGSAAQPSLEARAAALGVACRPLAELPAALAAAGRALVSRAASTPRPSSRSTGADPDLDAELTAILSELRLVKDEWEISQLRGAVDATIAGFGDVAALLCARAGPG